MGKVFGKYVENDEEFVSVSDISGFFYNCKDMVKQMEYRGNNLVWTGLMVGKDEVDEPQPQNKPFKAKKEINFPENYRPMPYVEIKDPNPYVPTGNGFVCHGMPLNYKLNYNK